MSKEHSSPVCSTAPKTERATADAFAHLSRRFIKVVGRSKRISGSDQSVFQPGSPRRTPPSEGHAAEPTSDLRNREELSKASSRYGPEARPDPSGPLIEGGAPPRWLPAPAPIHQVAPAKPTRQHTKGVSAQLGSRVAGVRSADTCAPLISLTGRARGGRSTCAHT